MMAGLILILLACVLILIALLVSFRILPQVGGSGAGVSANVGGTASSSIPPTPPYVRNAILGFFGVISLLLISVGLFLIVEDTTHSLKLQDALAANQQRLANLASTPVAPTVQPTRVPGTATPTPTGPRPSPTPTPAMGNAAAHDVLNRTVALDQAGNTAAAITGYKLAITGDLDTTTKQTAQLQIGLLSLTLVQNGNAAACNDAKAALQPLSTSASDAKTKQTASDYLKQAVKLCG